MDITPEQLKQRAKDSDRALAAYRRRKYDRLCRANGLIPRNTRSTVLWSILLVLTLAPHATLV